MWVSSSRGQNRNSWSAQNRNMPAKIRLVLSRRFSWSRPYLRHLFFLRKHWLFLYLRTNTSTNCVQPHRKGQKHILPGRLMHYSAAKCLHRTSKGDKEG